MGSCRNTSWGYRIQILLPFFRQRFLKHLFKSADSLGESELPRGRSRCQYVQPATFLYLHLSSLIGSTEINQHAHEASDVDTEYFSCI